MKLNFSNFIKAPVSSMLGVLVIAVLTGLLLGKFLDGTGYVALMTTTIPLVFSDPFGEKKTDEDEAEDTTAKDVV